MPAAGPLKLSVTRKVVMETPDVIALLLCATAVNTAAESCSRPSAVGLRAQEQANAEPIDAVINKALSTSRRPRRMERS